MCPKKPSREPLLKWDIQKSLQSEDLISGPPMRKRVDWAKNIDSYICRKSFLRTNVLFGNLNIWDLIY